MSVKLFALILTLLFVMAGCSGDSVPVADAPPPPPPPTAEVVDDDLSYRNDPLLTEIVAPAYVFDAPDAGEATLGERELADVRLHDFR